jgi:hypothetical protein
MTQPAHADWVRRIYCPAYGRDVTILARWDDSAPEQPPLLDFGCRSNGLCGTPSWDPCPLYVKLREEGSVAPA